MKFEQKQTYVTKYNDQISDYNVLERNLSHFHEISRNSTALVFLSHSKLCSLNLHSISKNYSHYHEISKEIYIRNYIHWPKSDYHRKEKNLSHFHEIPRYSTALIFLSHSKLYLMNLHSIYKIYLHFHEIWTETDNVICNYIQRPKESSPIFMKF